MLIWILTRRLLNRLQGCLQFGFRIDVAVWSQKKTGGDDVAARAPLPDGFTRAVVVKELQPVWVVR